MDVRNCDKKSKKLMAFLKGFNSTKKQAAAYYTTWQSVGNAIKHTAGVTEKAKAEGIFEHLWEAREAKNIEEHLRPEPYGKTRNGTYYIKEKDEN